MERDFVVMTMVMATVKIYHVKYVFHQQKINFKQTGKTLKIQIGMMALTDCSYGQPDCTGDEDNDYDMMCDEHRREYGENLADMRNDLD
jgi:hypothetical protein